MREIRKASDLAAWLYRPWKCCKPTGRGIRFSERRLGWKTGTKSPDRLQDQTMRMLMRRSMTYLQLLPRLLEDGGRRGANLGPRLAILAAEGFIFALLYTKRRSDKEQEA
jgi:hypothetical protein